jgi:hypothetical protein
MQGVEGHRGGSAIVAPLAPTTSPARLAFASHLHAIFRPDRGMMPLDTPVEPPNWDGYGALASRLALVEGDVRDIKDTLTDLRVMIARVDANMSYLATKADVAGLEARMEARFGGVETRFGGLEARLAEKPGKTYMWGMCGILGALLMAYACGLAALAILK